MKKEEINELIEPLNSENYLQLRNVSQLKRLPWIGRNYINNEPKVLILGDTHYAINMDGSFSEEGYQEFMQEESTINIVKCALEEGPWSFFSGLHRLFHLTNDNDLKKFWSNVAFYNFVQEVMHSKDSIPSDDNFSEAWICFCDVIDIINPDFCLFLGVRSETAIASIIECCGGNYFIQNGMEKCNGVFCKMLNHRSKMMPGSIEKILKIVRKYQEKKPILYFAEGHAKGREFIECANTDEFVGSLSYWTSWSAGIGFWRKDIFTHIIPIPS